MTMKNGGTRTFSASIPATSGHAGVTVRQSTLRHPVHKSSASSSDLLVIPLLNSPLLDHSTVVGSDGCFLATATSIKSISTNSPSPALAKSGNRSLRNTGQRLLSGGRGSSATSQDK
jgi:hypothetical protein